jgi:hypothetical protein
MLLHFSLPSRLQTDNRRAPQGIFPPVSDLMEEHHQWEEPVAKRGLPPQRHWASEPL